MTEIEFTIKCTVDGMPHGLLLTGTAEVTTELEAQLLLEVVRLGALQEGMRTAVSEELIFGGEPIALKPDVGVTT